MSSSFAAGSQSSFYKVSGAQTPSLTQFQLIEDKLELAHDEFINSVIEVDQDYYATCSSDYKVNLFSK